MIEFINAFTNTRMWVDESRGEEYTAAGHVPAVDTPKPEKKKRAPRKATR